MTGRELRTLRLLSGYTQAGLANLIGVNRMTVNRWELGARPIPKPIELLIKQLLLNRQK